MVKVKKRVIRVASFVPGGAREESRSSMSRVSKKRVIFLSRPPRPPPIAAGAAASQPAPHTTSSLPVYPGRCARIYIYTLPGGYPKRQRAPRAGCNSIAPLGHRDPASARRRGREGPRRGHRCDSHVPPQLPRMRLPFWLFRRFFFHLLIVPPWISAVYPPSTDLRAFYPVGYLECCRHGLMGT